MSGSVTLDGKPVPAGLIMFLPEGAEATTQGGATIADGKYAIPRDQGLVPGTYKVVISSPQDTPEAKADASGNNAPGMPPPPPKEGIPAEYGENSLLKAQVKDSGPNTFDFTLQSRAKGK